VRMDVESPSTLFSPGYAVSSLSKADCFACSEHYMRWRQDDMLKLVMQDLHCFCLWRAHAVLR
jgi:hypothetical protein